MRVPSWVVDLDQAHSSYLLLATLAGLGLAAGVLYWIGLLGWVLRALGLVVRGSIRQGFLLWERLFGWAPWPLFLAIVLGFLVVGGVAGGPLPASRVLCGLISLFMGTTACLAYMFIDLERYEVARGYKAIHNPLKGQELATHLARYGHQVRVPLLIAATVAMIGGFAQLNQGLYETIGRDWYQVGNEDEGPVYVDFLAYALVNLLHIVDVLNLAQSYHFLRAAYVHQAAWPASTLLFGFKTFFTLVLLQQLFASLRQGKLLAETIADFWSPHEPIHERARNALPQYGPVAVRPLLRSLRSVPSLTKEQRDQLPLIVATIGPSTIPALIHHLHDPHEYVRAVAAAALGQLHALDAVPLLAALGKDPSDVVRQSVVEALGLLGGAGADPARKKRGLRRGRRLKGRRIGWWFGWKKRGTPPVLNSVELAVATLQSALADDLAAVRAHAALALGRIGPAAAAGAPGLIGLLKDADETVRCQAAEALGRVTVVSDQWSVASEKGGASLSSLATDHWSLTTVGGATVAALVELLQDTSAPVKASAARALGALKAAAAPAVAALVPLLQDREEAVRTAAAEAIAQVGSLNEAATETLAEGLASPDNIVRAQTAEALGTIGAAAAETAPALVEAMKDGNDRVRGKAVEALGKIGESAAEAAVPGLVRALRDQDNWVSALAAEALGQMGESADGAIPALVRSLGHVNPQVRGNAAEALGKMGSSAAGTRPALEKAAQDEDGWARSQAVRALGAIGRPTPTAARVVLAGFQDADPLVRAAAVEAVGQWGDARIGESRLQIADSSGQSAISDLQYEVHLLPLLEDANDQVKVEVTWVLPRLAGATPAVIDGLCRRLLEDDSAWVQVHAALALGKLGPAAAAAGGPLLRAAQTGEVSVREQAMRALAMIQPPETTQAFTAGLEDACGDVRMVASAGWMKAAAIPEEVIPALVEALRDPEPQVRANAAHALARLDTLPAAAVPMLIKCTADANDGLRMNAALALQLAPAAAVGEVMQHLIADPNSRVRLIAAGSLLPADPGNASAGAVLVEALADPALRVRKAALELVESLGTGGAAFLEALQERDGLEEDPELRNVLTRLIERLTPQVEVGPETAAREPREGKDFPDKPTRQV